MTSSPAATMPLQDRDCPVCGSHDQSQVRADAAFDASSLDEFAFASRKLPEYQHHRLVECPGCGVLYASPIPAPGALGEAYREAAFDSAEEARFAARTYGSLLPQIIGQLPDTSAALDIGAGDGVFLEELLAAGFTNVTGVEPSAAPIRSAKPEVRGRIIHDIFRPESFTPGSFSLVCCFQTIEHVPDPLSLCRGALSLLKPGGTLLIVGHNRRALSNRLLGMKSPIIDIEHLQLFCPRSVQHLLGSAGFGQVRTMSIWNRYPLHYWFKLFPAPSGLKARWLPRLRSWALGRCVVSIPAGNLAAVARKPDGAAASRGAS